MNKRYKARLTKDIHDHLKRYGPTTARALTENLNPRYNNNLTTASVASLLRTERLENRVEDTEKIHKMIVWGAKDWNEDKVGGHDNESDKRDIRDPVLPRKNDRRGRGADPGRREGKHGR